MKGASTGKEPIFVKAINVVKKIHHTKTFRCFLKKKNEKTADTSANTPPNLLGIDRKIA